MKRQRIDFVIPLRNYVEIDEHGNPRENGISRVPAYHKKEFSGLTFLMGPANTNVDLSKYNISKFYSPMLLSLRIESDDIRHALDIIQKPVETILNCFSFKFHELFQPISMVMKDVTPSLKEGEVRTFQMLTEPSSAILLQNYINPQILRGINILTPDFSSIKEIEDKNIQIALWWFNKGLNAHFLIDSISFFFIAMDNLSKPYKKSPYKTTCNHEIFNCPTCGIEIEKVHFSDTLKDYLDFHNYSQKEIKDLLKIRNYIHGKNIFDFNAMFNNSRLIDRLRVTLHQDLMKRLKMKSNPIKPSTFTMAPFPYMSGTSQISKFDIEIENLFESI